MLPRPSRGQTLVLFAASMLFLVLLVCMILSTGMKVKEKMEVQSVADAAAFSNATATARAYNEVALMQRGQIGQMVAMAGVQSLISWTSYYRSQVQATKTAYQEIQIEYAALAAVCCIPYSGCTMFCKCAIKNAKEAGKMVKNMKNHQNSLDSTFDNLDKAAGLQPRMIQGAAAAMYAQQSARYAYLAGKVFGSNDLAKAVVKEASNGSTWASEWSVGAGSTPVNVREVSVLTPTQTRKHHLDAAMGSRGFSFVTNRSGGGMKQLVRLEPEIMPDVALLTDTGSGYWANSMSHAKSPTTKFSWADDHGGSLVTFLRTQAPCPPFPGYGSSKAHVKSSDSDDNSDEHTWKPGNDKDQPSKRHTLGKCIQNKDKTNCPGIWPGFMDYDLPRLTKDKDLFGQPKSFAIIQRDYQKRGLNADPWQFDFDFSFASGGSNHFSNNGLALTSPGQSLKINKQTALSTGLAYYHRRDHWQEPPNFFNPYWRATLVPATIDDSNGADLTTALSGSGASWAAQAWGALQGAGYKGGP